jgi:tetratricopeptide (TPR) repeat protein
VRRGLNPALVLLLLAISARAEPPDDEEEPAGDHGFSWSKAAHPSRTRYAELLARATELSQAGALAPAVTLLQQAVAVDPQEPYGYFRLGVALRELRRFGECADALVQVTRLRPDYLPPDAPGVRSVERAAGDCLQQSARFQEAIELYRGALPKEDVTSAPDIRWAMGQAYQALGRLDEAIEENAAAAAQRPTEAIYRFSLAVALDRDEQVTRARDEMAQGVRLNPLLTRLSDRSIAAVMAGDVYYAQGLAHQVAADGEPLHRGPAIVAYRKFIELDPDGPWRRRAREHLLELGPPAVVAADVELQPEPPAAERAGIVKQVVARGPELAKCLDGQPLAALRTTLALEPAKAPDKKRHEPKKPPTSKLFLAAERQPSVISVGPDSAAPAARTCVEAAIRSVRAPASQLTRVTVVVVSSK